MKCAGTLAYSKRISNQLRKEMSCKEKQSIREKLWKLINQQVSVKNQSEGVKILDFWGGGIFADYILDQRGAVNNQITFVLYELDNNPQLFPALRDYANRKNQRDFVNNQCESVIPVCSSLAKFVQTRLVSNQLPIDFIWLDYCGNINKEEQEDIQLCKDLLKDNGILAITTFCAREKGAFVSGKRKEWVEFNVQSVFPSFHLFKAYNYQNGHSPMATYVFKKKYKRLMKEVSNERFLIETGLNNFMFT